MFKAAAAIGPSGPTGGSNIMTTEAWLLPSILALLIWGVTAFLPKLALRTLSPLHTIVYNSFFFLATAIGVQFIFGAPEFSSHGALFAMGTGACGAFGQLLYLIALKRGPLTYVSMISSLYPLIATMLAFVVLHEPMGLRQCLGVALGISSIVLLVVSHDKRA